MNPHYNNLPSDPPPRENSGSGLDICLHFKKRSLMPIFIKIVSSTNCIIQTNYSLMFKYISKYIYVYEQTKDFE